MKRFLTSVAVTMVAGSLALGGGAFAAQNHHDNDHNDNGHNVHSDWKQGGHIQKNDWNRGQRVDYRSHHLRQPPRGYEWRQVDGNYVLAGVATGVIASIILSQH